jgi:Flp pilus assembly protein TadD
MIHENSTTETAANTPLNGSPEEQTRLDRAMRRADDLLIASLKLEERRRSRRLLILFSIGALIMLAIVCAILLGVTADTERSSQLAQEGWQLWQQQQFNQAVDKFQEAVKLDSKNVNAWNGLGWSQFNSGQYDKAEPSFKKLLDLEPLFPAGLNGLGQLYLIQKKYDLAEKYLLKAAPQAPAAQYGLARLYLLQGKYDAAAKWAKKAVASGDDDGSAKLMLKAAQQKKLPDELRKQLDPAGVPPGEVTQAWQLMNQGRRDEAKAIFEKALAKSPDDANVLNGLGWFYMFGGDMDQAKPYFEKALKADPKAAGAMNGLARVLKSEGHTDEAIKLWQEMVDKFPGANAGTAGLADTYMEQGEYKKAVPLLEQLVKANPQEQEFKSKLDQVKAEAGK